MSMVKGTQKHHKLCFTGLIWKSWQALSFLKGNLGLQENIPLPGALGDVPEIMNYFISD